MKNAATYPTKPISNFFIGFIGGLCAAFFPRLTAALAAQSDNLTFFPLPYVILGLVFAMLIGVIVAILQARDNAKPPIDTFMMALGIPAMLTGALNANLNSNALQKSANRENQAAQVVREQAQIRVLTPTPVKPIKGQTNLQLERDRFFLALWEVRPVYAQAGTSSGGLSGSGLGVQAQLGVGVKPRYLVVIDMAHTREEALQKAQTLRPQLPQVDVVQAGNDFLWFRAEVHGQT